MAVNSVCVTGNLVRDCEVFATKTGSEIATFTVAVNDRVKNGDEWEDYPNYIDCKLFNASKRIPKLTKNQPENPINSPGNTPLPLTQCGTSERGTTSAHSSEVRYTRQGPLGTRSKG